MSKKKREKPEDFIGWKSEDGKLEVIGIADETGKNGRKLFKVTCTKCSKDPELFPLGYFVSQKSCLKIGKKPCGCSAHPYWTKDQYLIITIRVIRDKCFIIHGFAEEFKNAKTKLNLECLKDGHKWTAGIHSIINRGSGCPKCAGNIKYTEQEALQKCIDICEEMNYDAIGFVGGYKNAHSKFEYICKIHRKQSVSYYNFVNGGRRCGGCAKDDTGFYGYYPERKNETDYLYILDFDGKFVKVGRSFDVERRISELQRESEIKKIYKLRIFTATHQEIYGFEQELHSELRERNFQHYVGWSTECFENDSLFILYKLLDKRDLEELQF